MQENYIVGIYARLSRDDERTGESVSIENQKEMLSRYVREQGCQGRAARQSRFLDGGDRLCCSLSRNYGGHTKMKTDNFCKENRPEAKKKLRLPDQLELVMEDGTVYRVRSFFVAEQQMGEVLDALSLEKVNREN